MFTKRRPRVALVGPMPPTKGGATTFMLNLMASYINADFEFIPYTTSRPPKKNVIDNWGYRAVFRGGLSRILTGIVLTIGRLLLFPFFLVSRGIDIVQIQASDYQVFWESAAYALAARLVGRPVLFRIGGAFDLFHKNSSASVKRLIATSLRFPQCIIVQSQFSYDYVRRAGRTSDILILPNWSRHPIVSNIDRLSKNNPICIFIAGAEAIRKGFEEVIEAARCLNVAGCPARFHFLAMVPQLVDRIGKLGLSNIAKIEGPVEHNHILEIMRQSDIFLLPSHGEGFPNSLIEAMAAGMASIVTPIAAMPEIVADGGALVVAVGDTVALAAAIERLASDSNLRRQLGHEARNTICRKYTPEKALPPLADAYWRFLR